VLAVIFGGYTAAPDPDNGEPRLTILRLLAEEEVKLASLNKPLQQKRS
jgi:hypothetical protein